MRPTDGGGSEEMGLVSAGDSQIGRARLRDWIAGDGSHCTNFGMYRYDPQPVSAIVSRGVDLVDLSSTTLFLTRALGTATGLCDETI